MAKLMLNDGEYGLVGHPESGYTMKVQSALRYKSLPYQWMDRFSHNKLYQAHAQVQLIPLVFLPDGTAMQDSTPIIELLEEKHPEPSIHPADPALRFLSELLEEYGDEWANKLMFHYRWSYPADQKRRSRTLAEGSIGGLTFPLLGKLLRPLVAPLLVRRMVPRMARRSSPGLNVCSILRVSVNLKHWMRWHRHWHRYLRKK